MIAHSMLLVIAASVPFIVASPVPAPHGEAENSTVSVQSAPQWYSGPWQNFPKMSTWLSFDDMFNKNQNSMKSTGDTWDDVGQINVAIRDAAKIGVDERVILGIIMQESHGNVGVQTTYDMDGVPTGGIMQSSNCAGHDGQHGIGQDAISAMVQCGTQHFKQNLIDRGNQLDEHSIYEALREYNSGSVDPSNLSNGLGATASYVSDIAQRLQGWVD